MFSILNGGTSVIGDERSTKPVDVGGAGTRAALGRRAYVMSCLEGDTIGESAAQLDTTVDAGEAGVGGINAPTEGEATSARTVRFRLRFLSSTVSWFSKASTSGLIVTAWLALRLE